MTLSEKQKRISEIELELERLQIEYASLLNRREALAAELQQLNQTRNRLLKLRRAGSYSSRGGSQLDIKS